MHIENVQSNVMMKKSWTTASITSALELEAEFACKAVKPFQSRDLIREYLLKSTAKVPEILKPQQCHSKTFTISSLATTTITTATAAEIDLAYKHPLVIAEELKHDAGEALAHDSLYMHDNSSIIIPQQQQYHKSQQMKNSNNRPHLIGKVTPSIARTWEQLTSAMDGCVSDGHEDERTAEEDKQSYVLFVRKPINFHGDNNCSNDFAVHHRLESEKFFDSIEEYGDDYEEEVEDDEAFGACGEVMASDVDSLEMRAINDDDITVWSIGSSNF